VQLTFLQAADLASLLCGCLNRAGNRCMLCTLLAMLAVQVQAVWLLLPLHVLPAGACCRLRGSFSSSLLSCLLA
jgi:hypothetical protein